MQRRLLIIWLGILCLNCGDYGLQTEFYTKIEIYLYTIESWDYGQWRIDETMWGSEREDQRKLENKTGFKVVKKVKYLGVVTLLKTLSCIKITIIKMWNEIKLDLHRWGKLALSLMGRIFVNKMTVLPRMFFLS